MVSFKSVALFKYYKASVLPLLVKKKQTNYITGKETKKFPTKFNQSVVRQKGS